MALILQRPCVHRLLLVAGFLVIAAAGSSQAAVSYSSLYVFGDSLTDSGNVYDFTTLPISNPRGIFPVTPPAAYTDGTHFGRFTNGLNFADVLANKLFSTNNGLTPSLSGGTNYAVGGATTGFGNVVDSMFPGLPRTGMKAQLAAYLAGAGSQGAKPKALYLVYGGANDMFSMLSTAIPDSLSPLPSDQQAAATLRDQTITNAVGNLGGILNSLATAGATSFLVPNLPDLGSTPRLVGTPGQTFAEMASEQFNAALGGMLTSFDSSHPGAKTMELDVFKALNDALDPSNLTFPNKTTGCYPGDPFSPPPATPTCTDPDKYVFWDDIHPTSAAHALLGAEAYSVVTVPEPRIWAVLLVGLALLFSMARHRSARQIGPVSSSAG